MVIRVIVEVHNEDNPDKAVEHIHHILNGCYEPGEVVYPVESLRNYSVRTQGRKTAQRRYNKQYRKRKQNEAVAKESAQPKVQVTWE